MSAAGDNQASKHEELTPAQQAAVKAAKQWVNQLARTIKTCRLYEAPTGTIVDRARLDLANELQRMLEEHGPLVLRFTSDDILTEGESLYPARSREDNLALPFYRDGVRRMMLSPGIDATEVGKVIEAILQVTSHKEGEDDLVTLLWQAQFDHVEIEYVPAEAEVGGGGGEDSGSDAPSRGSRGHGRGGFGTGGGGGYGTGGGGGTGGQGGYGGGDGTGGGGGGGGDAGGDTESDGGGGWSGVGEGGSDSGAPGGPASDAVEFGIRGYASADEVSDEMPWPETLPVDLSAIEPAANLSTAVVTDAGPGRSDDWQVATDTVEAEATFDELELAAAPGLEAFRARMETERNASTVTAAIELSRAYLAASETDEDKMELERFLSTVIRHAAMEGAWGQAETAFTLLVECRSPEWTVDALADDLCHPKLLAQTISGFETYDVARVQELIAFARRLGEWAIDLLGQVLAEVDGSRHQARLIDAIADECRGCPERLAPWLSDPRWPVVRNTVRILEEIGGDSIAGLLQAVVGHPEQSVRDAVVVALEQVSVARAKPMLIGLLDDVDSRTFCSILQRLGRGRDTQVAELMLGYLTHPEFEKQPVEERRAVYSAVVAAGGDEALPGLEAELHNQNWFDQSKDGHRQAVANCIVQIGTPQAKRVLERGAKSRRAALRKTCEDMLARFGKS